MAAAEGLVGRVEELGLAGEAVRLLGGGRASGLTIEGQAGIGKTRLVQCVVDEAHARGVKVFSGHAHPFERTRPFGVVAAALDLDRRSPDPRRAAIGALLGRGGATAADRPVGDIQYRVVEDIVDLVEKECVERPVLMVAEDVHWADDASLQALSSMVRRLPLSPLLVVVTARPSPQPTAVLTLLDDLVAGGARRLQLRELTPPDVATLAGQVLGAAPGPALTALLAKAGGNPLWAVALLRSLSDEGLLQQTGDGVEATTSELPPSLSDLVVRRLRPLPAETRELLRVAAVLGDHAPLRDVAAVAARSPVDVVTQLGDAFEAQLLDEREDGVVFRHQVVHDAIYEHIPTSARRLLHREAASALITAGASRLDVADHLLLGAGPGDEEAIAWLHDAAGEASERAPSVAVDLLRRAEELLPGGHPDADRVATEVVRALLQAGRPAEASTRAEAVLARQHAAEVDKPLRLALIGSLALQNRAAELISAAQAGLAEPDGLRPAEQVPMLAQQSWALTYSGDTAGGVSAARHALQLAEQADDAALTVWALTALLVATGRQGRFEEALAHARRAAALAAGSPATASLPLQPKLFLGLTLFECDLVDEARAAYRAALDDEFGSGWWLSDTLMADAEAAFSVGEWQDAVPSLIAGGEAAEEKDHPLLLSQSLAYRTVIATATGDTRSARELAARIVDRLEDDPPSYNAGVLAFAVAGLEAAEGDEQGAFEVLRRCWRSEAERGSRFYHRCLGPDLVRLALAVGDRELAGEVADALAEAVDLAPEVPTVRSQALRCQGLVRASTDLLLEAVDVARGTPLLVEHAGACEDAAALLARTGRGEDAARLLAEALERYERAGADAWAGRVRAGLRTVGVRPGSRGPRHRPASGWESLTATERTVSLLVAQGLTNGAVARQLYVSPHTVNSHLRHVFAKLQVANRVELAAVVHHSIE